MAKIKNKLPITVSWEGPEKRELYLDSMIKENNWNIGVEIGVRFGRTLFYLLDNNPNLKMYAVDIDTSQFYNQLVGTRYADRLVVLEGDSSTLASTIKETVDFVFIDGAHSKKAVIKDITEYRKILKDDRGLTGHDIDYPSIQSALSDLGINYDVGPDNVWTFKSTGLSN